MAFNQPWHQCQLKEIDIVQKWVKHGNSTPKHAKEMDIYKYNSVIPGGHEKMLYWKNLVRDDVTTVLRRCKSLNWCQLSTPLHVAKIPNDQHSLYHSISVSLWGFPDEEKILRSLLKATLKQHGPVWDKRLNLKELQFQAKDLKPVDGIVLPHHLFILANIIHRPLIVLSDNNFDKFDGIYLPLMSKPIDCSKAPIFLAYCNNKFWPLLIEAPFDKTSFEMKYQILFPLVNNDLSILPVKFLDVKEEMRAGDILQDYLIVKEIDLMIGEELLSILFLDSKLEPLPEDKNTMFNYVKTFIQLYSKGDASQRKGPSPSENSSQEKQNDDRHQTEKVESNFMNHPLQLRPGSISPHHAPLQQPRPMLQCGESIESSSREGFNINENGYCENQREEKLHPNGQMAPSAPEVYEEPMSMTAEQCRLCKTYRSSIKTFPYCHECFESKNGISQVPQTNEKSLNSVTPSLLSQTIRNDLETIPYGVSGSTLTTVNDHSRMLTSYSSKNTIVSAISPSQISLTPQTNGKSIIRNDITAPSLVSHRNSNSHQTMNGVSGPMLTSVSDQSEMLASYLTKNTTASAISPSHKVTGIETSNNNYSQNHQQQKLNELRGNRVLSIYHDYPSKHEDNCIEVSYDPLSIESPQIKCASPVCDKLIQSPEMLCQRCINILKVHHLSNCNKACCNSPDPPKEVSHSSNSKNLEYHKSEPSDVTKSSSYTSAPSVNQPTLQEKRKDSDFNQHKPSEIHEAHSISPEPEFAYSFPPRSVMVTSITSAYDTDQIMEAINNDSFSHWFSEIENNVQKDALKCKNPLCTNFGNKDREDLCNVCFSVKQIPIKHELDSMPVGISGHGFSEIEKNVQKDALKCKNPLCTNFGNKDREDLCNVCFSVKQIPIKHELDSMPVGISGHRFSEIEKNVQKDALKCKNPLCTNFGNKDREDLCNVCFSVKQIPIKHELDSMPVGISGHGFSEIEKNVQKDALKCKNPLCTNFGNKDREDLCNVCFSVKQIPIKHELDSMPVGISGNRNHDSYGQNMEQLEKNLKKTVSKCKTYLCINYGNKLKDDYCNVCYNVMLVNRQGHKLMYGEDLCDGVNCSMGTDETDVVSDLDSDVITSSQIDSSELFDLV